MVIIKNNCIIVSKDDPSYFYLRMNLSFNDSGVRVVYKNGKRREYKYNNDIILYNEDKNNIYIQRGLLYLLKGYFNNSCVEYHENNDISNIFNFNDVTYNNYKNILPSITLRDYQFLALRKILLLKKCIIQLPTGAGKTEIMASFIKSLYNVLNYYPTTIILEPTVSLVNSTIDRFKKYGIECYTYNEVRGTDFTNKIVICHPTSLCNDIEKNEKLLDNVKVLVGDECHHIKSITWRSTADNMNNLQYSIGLSATSISQDHVNKTNIRDFDTNELFIIGSTGRIAMNMISGTLIKQDALATPVIIRLFNRADEFIENDSWNNKVKLRLQSDTRNDLVCACSEFFSSNNRNILILVNTIQWSRKLLKQFSNYDLCNNVIASYGGGRFEVYDNENDKYISTSDNIDNYINGKYNILIGTSHLYEGFDVPNLDVIILAYGGKGDRVHLQGLGRVLRKTKNGKYAYIVDFSDNYDKVLFNQSNIRMDRYINNLEIPNDKIFDNVLIKDIENIFNKLEGED